MHHHAPPRIGASSSGAPGRPIQPAMPTVVAMIMASLAGWLVDGPVRALLGPVASMAVGVVVGAFAFFFVKRFLSDLRGGS